MPARWSWADPSEPLSLPPVWLPSSPWGTPSALYLSDLRVHEDPLLYLETWFCSLNPESPALPACFVLHPSSSLRSWGSLGVTLVGHDQLPVLQFQVSSLLILLD